MPDLTPMFSPSSVAVIGASDDPGKIGSRVLHTLLRHGYAGTVYPVNPRQPTIAGLPAYPRIGVIGKPVDLALIAIPAERVPDCLEECAAAGVRGAIIFSSGFADAGPAGQALQQHLREICQRTGIRVAGPNAEGFFNVERAVAATFSPGIDIDPGATGRPTQIGIVSQSGGLGFSFFNHGRRDDLPFSFIFSVGNQVDLELADYLDFLVDHDATRVILAYIESLPSAPRFLAAAQRAAERGKPIVAVKVGDSQAGRRAAASHTGAIAGSAEVSRAVLAHHGLVAVNDQADMLGFAAAFLHNPLPAGNRVGIVSTSGGTAVWLTDACEAAGLAVPEIDTSRRAALADFIPPFGATGNPVDITAQAHDGYARTLAILADAPYLDAFIVAASFAHERRLAAEGPALAELARRCGKPVLFYSYTEPSAASRTLLRQLGLHCFTSLQGCVRSLRNLLAYAEFQRTRHSRQAPPREAAQIPAAARPWLQAPPGIRSEHDSKALLAAYGIAVPHEILVQDAQEAVSAAVELDYPVALKLQSPDIPHKTEAGVLRLGLRDAAEVRAAALEVVANGRAFAPAARVEGILVQPMAAPGLELVAGLVNDATFGPMVMVGLGGIHVEVLGDIALAPAPLTPATARRLLDGLKARRLLDGMRGEAPRDVAAVVELLVRLSELAWDFRDRLAELDVNPILIHPDGAGATVVDALAVFR